MHNPIDPNDPFAPETTFHLVDDLNVWRKFAETAMRVVHDLQSPLTAIDELSYDLNEVEEKKRLIVRRAIARVTELSDQLLGEGKAILRSHQAQQALRSLVRETNLASLIEEVVAEKRLQFRRASRLDLQIFVESSRNVHLQMCSAELKAVLSNILNNAIEALPDFVGKVAVSTIPGADNVEIIVQDNGRGIAPWLKEKLGTPFTTAKVNGNGLGLYFAKLQMEVWKGSLTIDSKPNKGTSVSIVLPRL